ARPRRGAAVNGVAHPFGGASGLVGALIVMVVFAVALFAPVIAPFDPLTVSLDGQLAPPDAVHWFGTDQSGRDVLSRVIWGARPSLQIGIGAVAVSLL